MNTHTHTLDTHTHKHTHTHTSTHLAERQRKEEHLHADQPVLERRRNVLIVLVVPASDTGTQQAVWATNQVDESVSHQKDMHVGSFAAFHK